MLFGTPDKNKVFNFFQHPAHLHGALAYLDGAGHPDTACVAFSATPLLEIVFGTSDQSRKFACLAQGSHVGFNVTDVSYRLTVQLRGTVREISGCELDSLEEAHYTKLGESSRRFRDQPDQHFFLISPIETRFTNCMEEPWVTTVF